MNIVATAIARPVTVAMATFAVALFGGLSLDRLGLNLLPELAYPTLTVRTDFEGAAPAEVEEQITRRLEERVGVINGLRRMHSISAAERSDVVLEFAWGTDMTNAAVEVREKLDLVRLPLEVERPSILRLNPNLDPIARSAVVLKEREAGAETAQLQELRRFAEEVVKKRLDPVIGVAAVLVSGGFEDEIAVDVDQERLAQLGMSVQSLGQRLQAANINLSGGRLTARGEEFLVRTVNEFESVGDIADTIVFQDQGRVLRLRDVATVYESHKERDSVMRVDGNEAIEIAMYKEGDANTVAVAAAIHQRMDEIAADLPANYELVTIYDQAEFISAAIDEVRYAAIIGGLLAVIVLYLFLKDVRSTLIVTATIPVSVLATFVLMDAFDITLNIMSLGGIALAVGMLMDNAIVVLENIARHRNDPLTTLRDAARRGTGEMGGAVLASTMTTIAVFLPLAFVEGIAGQLFRDQALTVTFALLASLVLAFTLIPMLSAIAPQRNAATTEGTASAPWWRRGLGVPFRMAVRGTVAGWRLAKRAMALLARPAEWTFDQVYDRVFAGYDVLLRSALRFRALTLSVAFAALGGAAALVPDLPVELIPPLSQGEFRVDIELEPGTRLELTDALLAEAQQTLLTFPGVATTYSVAGTGGRLDASASRGGEQIGELSVVLEPDATPSDEARVMSLTRDRLESVPAAQFTVERPQLFTFATPLEIEIAGNDLQALEMVANRLTAVMSASPSFSDVESSIRPGYPELQIEFDQERTAATGLFVPDVANRVVRKIRGDVPTKFTWRDKRVDIRIRLDEAERNSKADVENLLVDAGNRQIRLGALAEVSMAVGPADIQRIGQKRVAVVSAHVDHGDLALGGEEALDLLAGIPHPPNVTSRISGQAEEMEASFTSLQLALLLALILVYLVMASLFESLLHPFVIMFTAPLAAIGAVLGIYLAGVSISVVVFIGAILLVGIVVNNAIVLVDRVNRLRLDGLDRRTAVITGARQRFRPIMMTTITTVLGLLPMAIGLGEASELRTPMAITVIGGLLGATLLTLVVIPVVYDLVDRKQIHGDVFEEARA
ncbi:MAG: efflux RND transporter permease subunit [Gammaproteobacteria bacterium]|nr:efflux RND transporter permease subunit [Gammaproteobacteria bacterium]MYK47104.1 efflux RND transporter permease subunit [Gammaproteobacteria bacterium]